MSETASFEEIIERDGYLVYTSRGFSMYPMIRQHKDLLIIKKITEDLKKYDVVLFRRNGKYILHRIIAVRGDVYDTAGDHNWWKEKNVRRDEIIGILTSFVRDGKEIPVTDRTYRMYVHLWCDLYPVRCGILFGKAGLRKVLK